MRLIVLAIVCFVLGCTTNETTTDAPSGSKQSSSTTENNDAVPTSVTIRLTAPNLLFRYLKDGKMNVTTSLDKVPEDQRHAIYIDDLDASPEARNSVLYLQRYDLSVVDNSKAYVGTPVLRADIEKQIRKERPKPPAKKRATGPSPKAIQSAKVVLYSTVWCGYCKKARKFLSDRKIPFVEKDIEKSPAAKQEMKSKAAKAGVRIGGVPVLDVNGRIIPGFDANAILQALDG